MSTGGARHTRPAAPVLDAFPGSPVRTRIMQSPSWSPFGTAEEGARLTGALEEARGTPKGGRRPLVAHDGAAMDRTSVRWQPSDHQVIEALSGDSQRFEARRHPALRIAVVAGRSGRLGPHAATRVHGPPVRSRDLSEALDGVEGVKGVEGGVPVNGASVARYRGAAFNTAQKSAVKPVSVGEAS